MKDNWCRDSLIILNCFCLKETPLTEKTSLDREGSGWGHREDKDWGRNSGSQASNQPAYLPQHVCTLELHTLSSRAHLLIVLYTPEAGKAEQFGGNKGTCVVKTAFLDLDRSSLLFESLMIFQLICHNSRVARRGELWETGPSQPRDQTNLAIYSLPVRFSTHQEKCGALVLKAAPPCPQTDKC